MTNPIRPAAEALAAEGRLASGGRPPTEKQLAYVEALRRRMGLPKRTLNDHCVGRFGAPLAAIDRRQASDLIDELVGWGEAPAELRRQMGQLDLL